MTKRRKKSQLIERGVFISRSILTWTPQMRVDAHWIATCSSDGTSEKRIWKN